MRFHAAIQISAALFCACASAVAEQRIDVEILPRFQNKPLVFDALVHTNASGQAMSLTRCDMLLSGISLQRDSGEWVSAEKWAAFVGVRDGRTNFAVTGVPPGKFTRLRFFVGVPPDVNAADPAVYPPNHPLNPSVNGLHWGWSGGFVFAALEGRWRSENGALGGYSYHVATDANLATVELPVDLDLSRDLTLKLAFDLSRVFGDIRFSDENATTHSREGDPLAAKLREQLRAAFSIAEVSPTPTRAEAAAKVKALIAPGATPYRFTFPATFPRPSLPLDNPLTNEGVSLGKRLFTETRLSGNHTQSCSSCHAPEMGFSDVRPQSTGADGDVGSRNSMPLMNLAWKNVFFWDGRAPSLRAQVVQPISNPIEMHTTLDEVVRLLSGLPHYPPMFEAAFGTPEITGDRVARALEQYLLTLIASDSKFDRAMRSQEALSAEEKRGFELFHTEYDPQRGQFGADCFHCHGGPLFLSTTFANNGLDEMSSDPGRFAATGNEGDRGKFATPSLRNVANTAPYMHDGRFATLEAVVEHYDHGVKRSATLDPNLAKHPREGMKLSAEDKRALVAFLKTLTESDH